MAAALSSRRENDRGRRARVSKNCVRHDFLGLDWKLVSKQKKLKNKEAQATPSPSVKAKAAHASTGTV